MEQLPGYLINGIITGSQYALFAAGLAIIFGVVRVFNFAHGVLFVAGGYAMYVLVSNEITTSPYIAVPIAGLLGGLVSGALLEFGVLTPTRRRGAAPFVQALATVGFAIAAIGALNVIVGGEPRLVAVDRQIITRVSTATITNTGVMTVVIAVVLMAGLAIALKRTKTGLSIRAVADAPADVDLLGYDSRRIVRFAVFLSATLAALSGAMLTAFLSNINPALGDQLMVKGVALVVVGGMGSLLGAVVAAFVVGIGESLSVGYLGSSWRESVALILLLLILLFRPSGLFGRSDMERL